MKEIGTLEGLPTCIRCSFNSQLTAYKTGTQVWLLNSQDLNNEIDYTGNFSDFNNEFKNTSDNHAPIKTSKVRGDTKPHVNKNLRKEIMKRYNVKNSQ